jgi:hypothetical protein
MILNNKLYTILFLILFLMPVYPLTAREYSEWSTIWIDKFGRKHPITVMLHNDTPTEKPLPMVVYLSNLDIPRLGTDSDENILGDLLEQQLLVIKLNVSKMPSSSPELEHAIGAFFLDIDEIIQIATNSKFKGEHGNLFFLPEGYRLKRDLSYWDLKKHGSYGTLEYILDVYNRGARNRDYDPVDSPEQMRGPDGQIIHFDLRMDIIYPSGQNAQKVPTMALFSSQSMRPRAFAANDERLAYPLGFALNGYAVAFIDHNYIPLARHEYFGHFRPFSLDQWNGLASASASIRFLRAHASEFNLNGRIGAAGLSKAAYSVVRLADPNHHKQEEGGTFDNYPSGSPESQPWPDFKSTISIGYASMGGGTRRTNYFTEKMVPMIFAAGKKDQYGEWDRFPHLVRTSREKNMHHLALWLEDLGHTYPDGIDLKTGLNRYILIRRWFDQNLYPHENDNLEVMYVIPTPYSDNVSLDGESRVLPAENLLPSGSIGPNTWGEFSEEVFDAESDMKHIPRNSPIAIGFARSIDVNTVTHETIVVKNTETNKPVRGSWQAVRQNSRFEFLPDELLKPNTHYSITVSTSVTDYAGRNLKNAFQFGFRTSNGL